MDEWDLLQRFARHGSQEAFTELVCRHLNFVYSSARRQVRSPQLAQEVTQAVFLELARRAAQLKPGAPLTAWLYLVTRRAALNALRSERRRRAREHAAYELAAMNAVRSVWEEIEPLLDEALATLNAHDRAALLLRYFECKPLREVGAALGASEDAAQKRVARAIEHLRKFFAKQGVAITAAGLAAHLSSHAVEAAPAALGGLISANTLSSASALAAEATHIIAMTTLQKTYLAAALVALGAGGYEIHALARGREQLRDLKQEVAALEARARSAAPERDAGRAQLASSAPAAPPDVPAADERAIEELVLRMSRLKQHFDANAALAIPEMALLNESDWLEVARERPLDAEADLRVALSRIRGRATGKLSNLLVPALSAYVRANDGRMPATARELQPHVDEPVPPAALGAMLARYEIKAQGSITQVPDQAILILEFEHALIDSDYDSRIRTVRAFSARDTDPFKINTLSSSIPGRMAPPAPRYLR